VREVEVTDELRDLPVSEMASDRLRDVVATGSVSGRGHDALLRVALTIADMEGAVWVSADHVDRSIRLRGITTKETTP
jgi:predicted ATPase with chaperone activity